MGTIFTKLRQSFSQGNLLTKLIFINVGVFVVVRLSIVLLTLFQVGDVDFLSYLQMPSLLKTLLYRPWTILTYMFLHVDFLHIIFNMLWLYCFGKIFLLFFNERQLGGLYVSGGIMGALFFLMAYNTFPYFEGRDALLMGASASVMAIVFAVSFYQKNHEINLMFVGRVKLIYLALFTLVIDVLMITSDNSGGHIAHLGGALFGVLFATQLQHGKDLTVFVNHLIDKVVNHGKRHSRMKVTYKKTETDMEYNARKRSESETLDAILDKLKHSGYESLSANEKKALFDASKK
jgi:membrane associated rhomboid family serine protease